MKISTSAPGYALPVKVGVVSVTVEVAAGLFRTGAGGAQSMPPGGATAVARRGNRSTVAVARVVVPVVTETSAVTTATVAVAVWPLAASVMSGSLTVITTWPLGPVKVAESPRATGFVVLPAVTVTVPGL